MLIRKDTTLDFKKIIEYITQMESKILSKDFTPLVPYPKDDLSIRWPLWNIFVNKEPAFHKVYMLIKNTWNEYKEINKLKYQPMWLQAWGNIHRKNEELGRHNHECAYWGWISINAEGSTTIMDNETIYNSNGQIVMCSGNIYHRSSKWTQDEYRITIGFDLATEEDLKYKRTNKVIPFE